jgi:hypothetical protein
LLLLLLMGTKSLLLILAACGAAVAAQPSSGTPDVQELIRRSVNAIESDWKQAPNYTFVERDVESKKDGAPTVKTYRVSMIEGSPYNRLIAVNDRALDQAEQAGEQRKLEIETARREHESTRERNKRTAKYVKERTQNSAMIRAMADAFDFHLVGEETVSGHDCWVLSAKIKPGYQPTSRETKVLTGMQGKLWIDKAQHQWVKVKAEVIRPVSFYGFFAKVGPGTNFVLEQEPIGNGIWLPKKFSMRVKASALGMINENSTDDETYAEYKPIVKGATAAISK